jgi:uroporphyrinogen decarboxylase
MAEMNDRFLRACRRQPTDRTPIWLMRQAGRYMPEYRAIRAKHGFLQMVKTPELAAQITLQPLRAFEVDAAIIFADILPVLEGLGFRLTYEHGEGPVIHNPIRNVSDVIMLGNGNPREVVDYTLDAIRLVKRELDSRLPLIGFSGAPFTLAAYAIEGGGSKDFRSVKRFMLAQPDAWRDLMIKLSDVVSAYLIAQMEAGADTLQIFDSWAGALSPLDYAEYVLPYVRRVIASVRAASSSSQVSPLNGAQMPLIYFGTDMSGMGNLVAQTGADVLGVDWRINLDEAWSQLGDVAIQGNLDPATLFAPWSHIERRTRDVLLRAAGRPGHVFNLGHGILTETPVDNVKRLVDFVHEQSDALSTGISGDVELTAS